MQERIIYLKSGKRRPVQAAPSLLPRDVQQDIPAAWCGGCGAMLYRSADVLCRRCKGGQENEEE